jgi:hypothetical protein
VVDPSKSQRSDLRDDGSRNTVTQRKRRGAAVIAGAQAAVLGFTGGAVEDLPILTRMSWRFVPDL